MQSAGPARRPRVRVETRPLKQSYRTLDQLLERKSDIECALYLTLRDLFSFVLIAGRHGVLRSDVDLFRGERSAHGHSRDGKPRNPQVLVGLVLVDGWPIAHHVFQGNWRDAKTVPEVLSDLEQRFGLKRVVFVGDRGMVTSHTSLSCASAAMATSSAAIAVAAARCNATGPWIECPVGITARVKQTSPKTLVQEVASKQPGVRVFVVHSEERQAFEHSQRAKAMDRVRTSLRSWRDVLPRGASKRLRR